MDRYEMMGDGWWAVYDHSGRLLRITKYLTTEENVQLADNNEAALVDAACQLFLFDSEVGVAATPYTDATDCDYSCIK